MFKKIFLAKDFFFTIENRFLWLSKSFVDLELVFLPISNLNHSTKNLFNNYFNCFFFRIVCMLLKLNKWPGVIVVGFSGSE